MEDKPQPTSPQITNKSNQSMFKDMILLVKQPYTAGIIATMWIGTAAFFLIEREVDIVGVIGWTMFASVIVAFVGFRTKSFS